MWDLRTCTKQALWSEDVTSVTAKIPNVFSGSCWDLGIRAGPSDLGATTGKARKRVRQLMESNSSKCRNNPGEVSLLVEALKGRNVYFVP